MSDAATKKYVKTWLILLVLLVISVIGPEIGIRAVTLITAFGIAIVKAYMVATKFMHLDTEKPYISYMLIGMLLMVGLFYAGVVVDSQYSEGQLWEKTYVEPVIESKGH